MTKRPRQSEAVLAFLLVLPSHFLQARDIAVFIALGIGIRRDSIATFSAGTFGMQRRLDLIDMPILWQVRDIQGDHSIIAVSSTNNQHINPHNINCMLDRQRVPRDGSRRCLYKLPDLIVSDLELSTPPGNDSQKSGLDPAIRVRH